MSQPCQAIFKSKYLKSFACTLEQNFDYSIFLIIGLSNIVRCIDENHIHDSPPSVFHIPNASSRIWLFSSMATSRNIIPNYFPFQVPLNRLNYITFSAVLFGRNIWTLKWSFKLHWTCFTRNMFLVFLENVSFKKWANTFLLPCWSWGCNLHLCKSVIHSCNFIFCSSSRYL